LLSVTSHDTIMRSVIQPGIKQMSLNRLVFVCTCTLPLSSYQHLCPGRAGRLAFTTVRRCQLCSMESDSDVPLITELLEKRGGGRVPGVAKVSMGRIQEAVGCRRPGRVHEADVLRHDRGQPGLCLLVTSSSPRSPSPPPSFLASALASLVLCELCFCCSVWRLRSRNEV
jgi:hypothetical protein